MADEIHKGGPVTSTEQAVMGEKPSERTLTPEEEARMREEVARSAGATIISGDLRSLADRQPPRGVLGRIRGDGRERPAPLPQAQRNKRVAAFTSQGVMDRWSEEAAGIRAVQMGDNVITMFGPIGEDFWSEGVTAKSVTRQLRAIGDRAVEVHINSPGGDLFEGIAIYNVLREHPQNITIKVMGMAASAASVISMAGDDIQIGVASFLMIHNSSVLAYGNRHEFREIADFLEPFDNAMVGLYVQRTGADEKDIRKWLDAETFMSGKEALDRGFADTLLSAEKTKVEEDDKVQDRNIADLHALENTFIRAGMTRTQARSQVKKLKGMPGAVQEEGDMPGAVSESDDWTGAAASLLATLRSK